MTTSWYFRLTKLYYNSQNFTFNCNYFRLVKLFQWMRIPGPQVHPHCRIRMEWRWQNLSRSQLVIRPRWLREWSRRRRELSWLSSTPTSCVSSALDTSLIPSLWWSVSVPVSIYLSWLEQHLVDSCSMIVFKARAWLQWLNFTAFEIQILPTFLTQPFIFNTSQWWDQIAVRLKYCPFSINHCIQCLIINGINNVCFSLQVLYREACGWKQSVSDLSDPDPQDQASAQPQVMSEY